METGIQAWIANHEFNASDSNARIELPGGWHWDISSKGIGFLKDSNEQLCVGYDLNAETIQFGANGMTGAPGLHLWIIQEMGEKFARNYFMDKETCAAYDTFAAERMEKRKEYEKGVRSSMTGIIQLEVNEGHWISHVDTDAVMAMTGIVSKPEITCEEGIALFNRMSEIRHVMPLRDPLGYMTLDDNVYNYIKDQYAFQYDDTIQNIDAGFINGNGRGCEAILDKLDATVRKNICEFCLPDAMNYQQLRYVKVTPDLQNAVDNFVKQRVIKTVNFEKKRDHSEESLAKDHAKFLEAGNLLKEQIGHAFYPPMDVMLEENKTMNMEM